VGFDLQQAEFEDLEQADRPAPMMTASVSWRPPGGVLTTFIMILIPSE